MKCDFDQELLTGHLDGELSSAEQELVEAHLPACGPCRQELDELQDLVGSVKSLPSHPVPDSLSESIRKEMAAEGAQVHSFPKKNKFPVQWLISTAALVFVGISVVYVGNQASRITPPMETQAPFSSVDSEKPADSRYFKKEGALTEYGERVEEADNLALEKSPALQNLRTGKKSKGILPPGQEERPFGLKYGGRKSSPRPEFLAVQSSNIVKVRADLEKSFRARNISYKPGAGSLGSSVYAKENCILVELTEEQLKDLQKQLGVSDDILVMSKGYETFYKRNRQWKKTSPREPEEDDEQLALLRDKSPPLPETESSRGGKDRYLGEGAPKSAEDSPFEMKGPGKQKKTRDEKLSESRKVRVVLYFLKEE